MVSATAVRNRIASVFTEYGSNATLNVIPYTYNNYGDKIAGTAVTSSLSTVPYNFFTSKQTNNNFGSLNEGEMDIIVEYGNVLEMGNTITFKGSDYLIKDVEEYYMSDIVVAKAVRVVKII